MALLRFLRHWLVLPSPIDLGWSESDALGLRQFDPYHEGKTWEDWTDHVKQHYPVRYFLLEVVPRWFRSWVVWPSRRIYELILDHLLPSRRYHQLDLRGVDPLSVYRHGYLDPCDVFWLAGWASLMRWDRERRRDTGTRKVEIERNSTSSTQYAEALELVHYWTVTRIEREEQCNQLHAAVNAILPSMANRERYEAAQDVWLKHFRASQELDQSMWSRLSALRTFLWH